MPISEEKKKTINQEIASMIALLEHLPDSELYNPLNTLSNLVAANNDTGAKDVINTQIVLMIREKIESEELPSTEKKSYTDLLLKICKIRFQLLVDLDSVQSEANNRRQEITGDGENHPNHSLESPAPAQKAEKSWISKNKYTIGTSLFAGASAGTAVGLTAAGITSIPAAASLITLLKGSFLAVIASNPIGLGIAAGIVGTILVGGIISTLYNGWKSCPNCCDGNDAYPEIDEYTASRWT